MKKRFGLGLFAVLVTTGLLSASPAAAATEFGDPCIGNRGSLEQRLVLFSLGSPASPLPAASPTAGVITSWKTSVNTGEKPAPAIIPQTLKVLRVNAAAKTVQVIGESSGLVGSGLNTIPARIPVQPGDRLGLYGAGPVSFEGSVSEPGTLFCEGEKESPEDLLAAVLGNPAVGTTAPYVVDSGVRVPAVAVVEPDADNDGHGDETQDKCPQSAAAQVACPIITLSAKATAGKNKVTVTMTSTFAAAVTVSGKAPLGKGKKANLKAGPKTVQPGSFTSFQLKFPKKLIKRLKAMPTSKKLTLTITSSAPNVASPPTTKMLKVKLKGRAKP